MLAANAVTERGPPATDSDSPSALARPSGPTTRPGNDYDGTAPLVSVDSVAGFAGEAVKASDGSRRVGLAVLPQSQRTSSSTSLPRNVVLTSWTATPLVVATSGLGYPARHRSRRIGPPAASCTRYRTSPRILPPGRMSPTRASEPWCTALAVSSTSRWLLIAARGTSSRAIRRICQGIRGDLLPVVLRRHPWPTPRGPVHGC